MPTNQEAAAALIRAALAERDTDAMSVARATGLDKNVLYNLLGGKRWPRPQSLARIERHFGWEPGTLTRAAESDPSAPQARVTGGVVLDVDPAVLGDLDDAERDEAATAALAAFMERARQIRAFRS